VAPRDGTSQRGVVGRAQHYCDLRRESDIYEHFARRPANVDLIVRASWNRKIKLQSGDFAPTVCVC